MGGVSLIALLGALTRSARVLRTTAAATTLLFVVIHYFSPIPYTIVPWFVGGMAFVAVEWMLLARLARARAEHPLSPVIFYASLAFSIAPLVFWRIAPLSVPEIAGFIGLAYFTLRIVDVLFDIKDGRIMQLPFWEFFTYVLFFPTLSSGPIDRYRRFHEDWVRTRSWQDIGSDIDRGVHFIFRGLLYKYVIEVLIWRFWLIPAAAGTGLLDIASYMYAYTFFLFFDFAAYSAFALGFSAFFGIHPPENFNMPFIARNIRDFWSRWHISLSFWFRDVVYSRFVYAGLKARRFGPLTVSYAGYIFTMTLMGLWHGVSWHFVIYGLYHALLLIGYDVFHRWNAARPGIRLPGWFSTCLSIFITFNMVAFGMLIFSGHIFFDDALSPTPAILPGLLQ
jgi:membrane protein involved in D-alanine export